MFRIAAFRFGIAAVGVLAVFAGSQHAAAQQMVQPGYGQPGYGQPGYGQQTPPPMSGKQMFASTLGAIVQAGAPLAVSALAGTITAWLQRKASGNDKSTGDGRRLYKPGEMQMQTPGYVSPDPGTPPPPPEDEFTPDTGEGSDWQNVSTEVYDDNGGGFPSTDTEVVGEDLYGPPGPPRRNEPSVYAGVAYEIHAAGRNGASMRVDPASHMFRTGERFVVHYRPTLPGRVDVHNVNPAGRHTLIDSVEVAGGELASLGPYQFTAMKGNETLILQLSPCSSSALIEETYTVTRDIVKADDYGSTMQLSECSGTTTRALTKTRDIVKVSVEDGTAFALDPVSQAEIVSGDISPRQVTITLMHR